MKLENVLVGEKGHVKFCDFGMSKSGVFETDWAIMFSGTVAYVTPEVLKAVPYRHEADWW
jgi:protein-serine/threonine kinase